MSEHNRNQSGKDKQSRRRRKRPLALTALLRLFQTVGTLLLVVVLTGSIVCCYAAVYVKTVIMPEAEIDLSAYTMDENTVIYYYDDDGNAVELATLSGSENRQMVTYNQIPQDLIDAFVAIEDERFWLHDGVDWYRTAGALVNMFFSMRNTFGGSTITQQLVKNVTGYDDATVTRKILEIFSALELENTYTKEDILTWYLNEIYLGDGCYGVQAAAQHYFGKDVWELSLAECASLAGITNNPSQYGPYAAISVSRHQCQNPACRIYTLSTQDVCSTCGGTEFGEDELWDATRWNKARQELILKQMAKEDISPDGAYITQAEYKAALAEELVFARDKADDEEDGEDDADNAGDIHSWYVDAVISEVIADLQEKLGVDYRYATQMVYSGGLSIYVPYDPDVQAAVDTIYNDNSNLSYVSKTGQEMSSAITVVDNRTGYVVAISGDVGEKTGNRLYNNALANQQPGSSIKPISVYAPALEMGLITPAFVSDDNPRILQGKDTIWPTNAPAGYRGLTTIQDAVVRSVNTIAVNVLELVTMDASYEFMTERFGITSLVDEDRTALGALAMGGLNKGISTFEMAAAYATFPRNGAYTEPTTYLTVKDYNGQVIIDNKPDTEFVLKESTVYYVNSMLTAAVNTGTGYYARIPGQVVAGKTGTTNNVFDLWFAGYTQYYTAAVWTGYPYDEYMNISGNPSVTLWQKVMAILHEDLEKVEFYKPDDVTSVTICRDCGKLATSACQNDLRGDRSQTFQLLKSDRPNEFCSCHVTITICTESPVLNENGKETGAYYLATEYCPEECVKEVTVVDYDRYVVSEVDLEDPENEEAVAAVRALTIRDYYMLLPYIQGLTTGAVVGTTEEGEPIGSAYCPNHAAPTMHTLTVTWQDTAGNLLAETEIREIEAGETYTVQFRDFEDYILSAVVGDYSSGIMDSDKSVTFIYELYQPEPDPDPEPSQDPDPEPSLEPDPEPSQDPAGDDTDDTQPEDTESDD